MAQYAKAELVMQTTDVAIVGGGFAGSLCAAMLGRAGIDAVLIDPNPVYPPEFRCEKLDGPQLETLQRTGFAEAVVRAATPDRESWVARFGRVVDKRPGDQLGIMYDTLVNTVRAQIPARTPLIEAKAIDIITGPERQLVRLSNGVEVAARLVVLANGLNIAMQQKLGITRRVISPRHSISIGFDVRPVDRPMFPFPALTYYSERARDRMALITLFPIGQVMRANLFAYRDAHDPWFDRLREAPEQTLSELWPNLRQIMGAFSVSVPIKLRPVDLYVTDGYQRDGLVTIGDAFSTSCPAAGTGARKALVDAERLCNVHIPRWLATAGMQQAKIAAFYGDPVKQACEVYSASKAFALRDFSTNPSLGWTAKRSIKFVLHVGRGLLRQARKMLTVPAGPRTYAQPAPAATRGAASDQQVHS
jgi:2-polyprenyl-6-methoxyphenol hydroxylase-like FAD-dependent oxidoreductase